MTIGAPYAVALDDAALDALRVHWGWLLGDRWTPLRASALGDVFVRLPAGTVWWLCTASGTLEQVAESPAQFDERLGTERTDEWFLPGLVDALRAQGKVPGAGQCYTFDVFPVFSGGAFSAENMRPVAAAAHFAASGRLHARVRRLPEGTPVQVIVADADEDPPGAGNGATDR